MARSKVGPFFFYGWLKVIPPLASSTDIGTGIYPDDLLGLVSGRVILVAIIERDG